jgi:hypothetical protein
VVCTIYTFMQHAEFTGLIGGHVHCPAMGLKGF